MESKSALLREKGTQDPYKNVKWYSLLFGGVCLHKQRKRTLDARKLYLVDLVSHDHSKPTSAS